MDENNVTDITMQALNNLAKCGKQPWYKRAWNKVKRIASSIGEWCLDHIEIICGIIWAAAIALCWLFGWIAGRQEGYDLGKADGKREGLNEGYLDCTKDLKSSGYQMYGGYGDDSDKVIVKKISEGTEIDL